MRLPFPEYCRNWSRLSEYCCGATWSSYYSWPTMSFCPTSIMSSGSLFHRSEERRVGKECICRYWRKHSSRRRHTRYIGDWSSDVCSSDLGGIIVRENLSIERNEIALSGILPKLVETE